MLFTAVVVAKWLGASGRLMGHLASKAQHINLHLAVSIYLYKSRVDYSPGGFGTINKAYDYNLLIS